MTTMTVRLRSIPDTEAAVGWAGSNTVVVDRPDGRAGGLGLGFNGGQLLAMAIGGCFCNDLHYVAHEKGVRIASLAVDVTMTFEGSPLLATGAEMRVDLTLEDKGADVARLIQRAQEISTVRNSLQRGIPVAVVTSGQ
jgi:organic hydroperoxide reductase OsmC/OhrA